MSGGKPALTLVPATASAGLAHGKGLDLLGPLDLSLRASELKVRRETGQVHLMRDKPGPSSQLLDQHFKRRGFLEILTSSDPESLRAPRSASLNTNFPFIPVPTCPVVMALLSPSPCLWSSDNPGSFAEIFSFYQRHLFSNYE